MATGVQKIVKRNKKVAFMKVADEWLRMTKFTEMNKSKNPSEYSRRYVDMESETTDVVGYSESISYSFDKYTNNIVHDRICEITDNELTGDDANVEIMVIDFTEQPTEEGVYTGKIRTYAVIPDSEGDSNDAYTYSGTFKAKSGTRLEVVNVNEYSDTATTAAV